MKKYMKSFWMFAALALVVLVSGCGGDDDVAVSAITLDKTEFAIDPGATQQLIATVVPEGATNKRIVWSSDNETIATVTANGLVTGGASGNTKIWVKTSDGAVSTSATVTVNNLDFANDIVGSYKGNVIMGGTTSAIDVVATLVRASANVVTITTEVTIMGLPIGITCTLNVSKIEEGKYALAGTGITSDYGQGQKAITASGTIDDGNIDIDLKVDSIDEAVQYAGKKQ